MVYDVTSRQKGGYGGPFGHKYLCESWVGNSEGGWGGGGGVGGSGGQGLAVTAECSQGNHAKGGSILPVAPIPK